MNKAGVHLGAPYVGDGGQPESIRRSLDYCNSFWGPADDGVEVLLARMRSATRTMEEVRGFWKERASIEESYAKRLAKLSQSLVGQEEIGGLCNALEVLREETGKQASCHLRLAQQIRDSLVIPATTLVQYQLHHRKTAQAVIEKQFKTKQAQEAYVKRAKEKYEQDCLRANVYAAQSELVQGKALDRVAFKLERARQTAQASESDFASSTRVLQNTIVKWEQEWKVFCDSCQDLEDDRMALAKDNTRAYADAVATVCIRDIESLHRLRRAWEEIDPKKDQDNFVLRFGTGNRIPSPPQFVDYSQEDPLPHPPTRSATLPAQFKRISLRHSYISLLQNEGKYPSNTISASSAHTQEDKSNAITVPITAPRRVTSAPFLSTSRFVGENPPKVPTKDADLRSNNAQGSSSSHSAHHAPRDGYESDWLLYDTMNDVPSTPPREGASASAPPSSFRMRESGQRDRVAEGTAGSNHPRRSSWHATTALAISQPAAPNSVVIPEPLARTAARVGDSPSVYHRQYSSEGVTTPATLGHGDVSSTMCSWSSRWSAQKPLQLPLVDGI